MYKLSSILSVIFFKKIIFLIVTSKFKVVLIVFLSKLLLFNYYMERKSKMNVINN